MRAWIPSRLRPAVAALLVTVWVFPRFMFDVSSGLDPSWGMGLHMARHHGLRFGRDLVYTFGPLGFLVQPVIAYPAQGLAAGLLRIPLLAAVAWFVARQAERVMPWWLAVAAAVPLTWALAVPQSFGGDAPGVLLVLGTAAGVSRLLSGRRVTTATLAGLGVGCSACTLVKVDVGLVGFVALALFIVCEGLSLDLFATEILTRLCATVGAQIISLCALWMAVGQRLGDLARWTDLSLQIVLGHNASMGGDFGRPWWLGAAAAAVLCVVGLTVWAVWAMARRRQVMVAVFTGSMLLLGLKQAFLRSDAGHLQRLMALLIALTLVLVTRRSLPVACALSIALVMMVMAINDAHGLPFLKPQTGVRSVRYLADMTTSASRRAALVAWGHRTQPMVMKVPPRMISRIGTRTAHIEPWDASVAWVYNLRWKPLPVFQTYMAYTDRLDRLNVDALTSDTDAPQTILHQSLALDGRIPRFQSPSANVAMLCNYLVTEVGSDWNLFERDEDRCAAPRPVTTITAHQGQPVSAPFSTADEFLVARFDGLEPGLPGALRAALLRPSMMTFRVGADPVAHRFVVPTQHKAHIIRVPQCLQTKLGSYDTSSYDTFTISPSSAMVPPEGPAYRVSFETIPYRCP